MKFSIIHPTARVTPEFAHPWWIAAHSALKTCDYHAEVEYILVVHHSRYEKLEEYLPFYCADVVQSEAGWGRFTVVINYGRDCLVDQSNAGVAAASGEIILGNQDDMRYPAHW